ncbi:MAG: hypothetical protein AABY22_07575 [Nanoarchaeota archaeon]
MEAQTIVNIHRNERQNSFQFRYGGTGSEVKLYFEDATDLEQQLVELTSKGSSIKQKIDILKYQFKEKGEETK